MNFFLKDPVQPNGNYRELKTWFGVTIWTCFVVLFTMALWAILVHMFQVPYWVSAGLACIAWCFLGFKEITATHGKEYYFKDKPIKKRDLRYSTGYKTVGYNKVKQYADTYELPPIEKSMRKTQGWVVITTSVGYFLFTLTELFIKK